MAIVRSGHVVVPRGDTVLQPDDEVLALVTRDSEEPVRHLLIGGWTVRVRGLSICRCVR